MINKLWLLFARHLDPFLMACALGIAGLGLVVLFSAGEQSLQRVGQQIINLGAAFVAMWIVANLSPHTLQRFAVPLYLLGIVLLLGVALFGEVVNGARRWLSIGVTRIQPAELLKIALPLLLAWFFAHREGQLKQTDFLIAAILLVIPTLLIVRQPDLGTALLVAATGFYVLYLAGLHWKIMTAGALLGLAALPFAWPLLHEYQQKRILTLLDPGRDPLGAGYHILQSSIALGSGGLSGKGWLNGTQAHLDFLPERHTDFIFAVFGEEFGLIGNVLLLILYLLLLGRGFSIARTAPTLFSRLSAGAITLMFFTYAFVNMGMVSGILPVVGIPLPLMSYGGTAMVTLFLGLGILMSIKTHR